ncbi:MAG: squalene/phytoene synthase family protein [Acidobacteria bacterium]|nr:squalene/phytoene synthase family protein [Acidobacteriota bacterium]
MTMRRAEGTEGGPPGSGSGGPGSAPPRSSPLGNRELLRQTSRTFALSVELLPGPLRRPVEAAYLLARIGDTVADRGVTPTPARIDQLERLRGALAAAGPLGDPLEVTRGFSGEGEATRAEAQLLAGADGVLARLERLPAEDRADVQRVVDRLLATMIGELRLFEEESRARGGLAALPDGRALGAYTEGIAGCVGEFWTRLAVRHAGLGALAAPGVRALVVEGRRYGRGLQLVNVLRDLPRDLRRGRCFLPADELRALGLAPADLLDPAAGERVAPLLARWQARARRGLVAGTAYTRRLGRAGWRVRAATLLPAALGLATLRVLEAAPSHVRLDPQVVLRVSRGEVRRIAARTALRALWSRGGRHSRLAAPNHGG